MEKDELAEDTDLRSLCVPQKGSLAQNNLDQGLFCVVNSTAGVLFLFWMSSAIFAAMYAIFAFFHRVIRYVHGNWLTKICLNPIQKVPIF